VPAVLRREIMETLSASGETGWVLEPEAKRLLALSGLAVPKFGWGATAEEALRLARGIGYPVVAKVVSPKALHKSEVNGVAVGIENDRALEEIFNRFRMVDGFKGVLVEEMVPGAELIVGAKIDHQFGPVILLGIGGTGVEIYKDVAIRMAPLQEKDVSSMVKSLKARRLLEGYRGSEGVDLEVLTGMLIAFSDLVMGLEAEIESIDLNPVKCTREACIIVDARIILKDEGRAT